MDIWQQLFVLPGDKIEWWAEVVRSALRLMNMQYLNIVLSFLTVFLMKLEWKRIALLILGEYCKTAFYYLYGVVTTCCCKTAP